MYRWCAKHGRLVMFLWAVPISAIFWSYFLYLELPIWIVILFTLFMIITAWGFVNSCARQLLLRAEKSLREQCDPYPLLKETEDQLSYNRSQTYKQILLIDYCLALRNIGEYKKVLEQLETINIDKYAGTLPINKLVYYNNLTDIYLCMNALEKAEIWHNKSLQLLNDLKNKKQKKMFSTIIRHNSAEIAYYKQDYDKSFEILNNITETNMRDAVYKALFFAKIYIAQGKIDEAKLRLQFVVENGNKLIDMQIAKDLLANI
jgi:tetratricopeptide (TPR) repeat protein